MSMSFSSFMCLFAALSLVVADNHYPVGPRGVDCERKCGYLNYHNHEDEDAALNAFAYNSCFSACSCQNRDSDANVAVCEAEACSRSCSLLGEVELQQALNQAFGMISAPTKGYGLSMFAKYAKSACEKSCQCAQLSSQKDRGLVSVEQIGGCIATDLFIQTISPGGVQNPYGLPDPLDLQFYYSVSTLFSCLRRSPMGVNFNYCMASVLNFGLTLAQTPSGATNEQAGCSAFASLVGGNPVAMQLCLCEVSRSEDGFFNADQADASSSHCISDSCFGDEACIGNICNLRCQLAFSDGTEQDVFACAATCQCQALSRPVDNVRGCIRNACSSMCTGGDSMFNYKYDSLHSHACEDVCYCRQWDHLTNGGRRDKCVADACQKSRYVLHNDQCIMSGCATQCKSVGESSQDECSGDDCDGGAGGDGGDGKSHNHLDSSSNSECQGVCRCNANDKSEVLCPSNSK